MRSALKKFLLDFLSLAMLRVFCIKEMSHLPTKMKGRFHFLIKFVVVVAIPFFSVQETIKFHVA